MPTHKFKPYQIVLLETSLSQNIRGGAYMITKQMPERDGECVYCVKSINEPYERVVREGRSRKIP